MLFTCFETMYIFLHQNFIIFYTVNLIEDLDSFT